MRKLFLAAAAATAVISTAASAEVDIPTFVGKGAVQSFYSWNNKALQNNANDVQFRFRQEIEWEWTCTKVNNRNEVTQERSRTERITATITTVGRLKNQITGFYLTPGTVHEQGSGQQLGHCPSSFELTDGPHDTEISGGLQIRVGSGGTWADFDY